MTRAFASTVATTAVIVVAGCQTSPTSPSAVEAPVVAAPAMAQLGEEYPSATALELTPRTHRRFQVWGGPDYEVFLGCFDCSEYDSESIWNPYGRYGSEYSSTSINNPYSRYGSRYSPYSACNEYATQPPILWDSVLDRYAELTLNQYRPYAITDRDVLFALRGLCFD